MSQEIHTVELSHYTPATFNPDIGVVCQPPMPKIMIDGQEIRNVLDIAVEQIKDLTTATITFKADIVVTGVLPIE